MQEQDLINNKELREKCIGRTEVLDKVGNLILLPNTELATVEQVAKYYNVNEGTIQTLVDRNIDELKLNGYSFYTQEEVVSMMAKNNQVLDIVNTQHSKNIIFKNGTSQNINNAGLRLFPRQAILRMAFLLTESEVAQQVRQEVLKESPELYYELSNAELLRFKKYEQDMECFLKALFGEDLVKTQVPCGKYKLDFVIDDTIHIEVNEYGHSGYDKQKEKERKKYIFDHTDYWSYDFNPHKESRLELLHDIFKLYEHIGFPEIKENI